MPAVQPCSHSLAPARTTISVNPRTTLKALRRYAVDPAGQASTAVPARHCPNTSTRPKQRLDQQISFRDDPRAANGPNSGSDPISVMSARHLVVVISTYNDPRDSSDHGVNPAALTGMVDSVIAPALPS